MISLQSVSPSLVPASIVERFFITTAQLPEGQYWENKLLPSIMQSIVIDFDSHPPLAKFTDGRQFLCPGDLILGQFTKSCISVLEGKLDCIGIQFTPTGLYRVLGTHMQQFADTILPLSRYINWHQELREALQSASTTTDRIAVIEHFICQNLKPVPIYLEVIAKAAELLRTCNERASITELCKELGMSERTFQRYFKQYIGVSPKAFAQVARFNSVTKLIEQTANPSWLEILDATGYFDSAHFANDFKRITGKTPSDYYKGKTHYEKFFNAQ